jgi:hypothetical protein
MNNGQDSSFDGLKGISHIFSEQEGSVCCFYDYNDGSGYDENQTFPSLVGQIHNNSQSIFILLSMIVVIFIAIIVKELLQYQCEIRKRQKSSGNKKGDE